MSHREAGAIRGEARSVLLQDLLWKNVRIQDKSILISTTVENVQLSNQCDYKREADIAPPRGALSYIQPHTMKVPAKFPVSFLVLILIVADLPSFRAFTFSVSEAGATVGSEPGLARTTTEQRTYWAAEIAHTAAWLMLAGRQMRERKKC
jgi:hypothetical protein